MGQLGQFASRLRSPWQLGQARNSASGFMVNRHSARRFNSGPSLSALIGKKVELRVAGAAPGALPNILKLDTAALNLL